MSYIQQAILQGFQSHVASHFKLGPGLNVITGPTDSGKTALIRAIRWLAFEDQTKPNYVNQTVGSIEVTVVMDDGAAVTKRRKGTKTSYEIILPGQPPTIFEKAEIPEEVTKILGLAAQKFGVLETQLNFSYQLEEPFLISKPASNGAMILGKLAGTEVVDLAIKSVAKETYAHNQEKLQAAKAIEKLKGELAAYADLPDQIETLEAAEYLLGKIELAVARATKLKQLQTAFLDASTKQANAAATVERLAIIPTLVVEVQKIEKDLQRRETLQVLTKRYGDLIAKMESVKQLLTKLAIVESLSKTLADVERLAVRRSSLFNLSTLYDKNLQEVNRTTAILAKMEGIAVAADILAGVTGKQVRVDRLKSLQAAYSKASTEFDRLNKLTLYVALVEDAAGMIPALEKAQARQQRLKDFKARYTVKAATYEQAKNRAEEKRAEEVVARLELKRLWAEIKVCPTCEQPLQGVTI
jgi:exonuclease SbcC